MPRVLITGSAGFLGRHLLAELHRTYEITALTRTSIPPMDGVEVIELDLQTELDAGRLPPRVDAVVHLAQARAYRDFPERAGEIFAVNVASTMGLLEYARRAQARTFIYASTGGLYGLGADPFAEASTVNPERFLDADPGGVLNFYFATKYIGELLLRNYVRVFRTVAFRFFFLYGAEQRGMLVRNLVDRVRAGDTITVRGRPGMHINPIHVRDAVRVFAPALTRQIEGAVNVAGSEIVSIEDLVRTTAELAGVPARIEHAEGPNGDLIADITRMRTELRIEPRITLREGLAELLRAP